jgi:hypothetical protein
MRQPSMTSQVPRSRLKRFPWLWLSRSHDQRPEYKTSYLIRSHIHGSTFESSNRRPFTMVLQLHKYPTTVDILHHFCATSTSAYSRSTFFPVQQLYTSPSSRVLTIPRSYKSNRTSTCPASACDFFTTAFPRGYYLAFFSRIHAAIWPASAGALGNGSPASSTIAPSSQLCTLLHNLGIQAPGSLKRMEEIMGFSGEARFCFDFYVHRLFYRLTCGTRGISLQI